MVKDFEKVSASKGHGTWVAFYEIKVFFSHVPNKWLEIGKKGWVSQVSFSCHHRVSARFFKTSLDIRPVLNIPVRYHRNVDSSPITTKKAIGLLYVRVERVLINLT